MPPKKTNNGGPCTESMAGLYIKHYQEQQAKYGEKTAILLQVGRFFEMYDTQVVATGKTSTNLQTLAEICGCAVEPKPTADPARLKLFWGFPESALEKYERILVLAGYSVVVVVQNKDGADKVVSRTIDHVSSPGTYFETEGGLGVRNEEQCMVGMYIEPYTYEPAHGKPQRRWSVSVTAFNINTGQSVSTEAHLTLIDDRPVCDAIQPFLSMYPPAEAVVWWSADMTDSAPLKNTISQILGLSGHHPRPNVHMYTLDKKEESGVNADRLRLQFFKELYCPATMLDIDEYLDVARWPMIRRSLFHLLSFIKDHNASCLQRLTNHTIWESAKYLILGNVALEQLSMISPNSSKSHESLLHWLQKATTAIGRRHLRQRCLTPIADVAELSLRQTRVEFMRTITDKTVMLGHLRAMYDLSRIYRRFALGRGSCQDLLCLLTSYMHVKELIHATTNTVCGLDADMIGAVMTHIDKTLATWDVQRIRTSCSQVDTAVAVGSFHPWVRGCQPELDTFEDRWQILETEASTIRDTWCKKLEKDGEQAVQWTIRTDAPFTMTTTARRAASLQAYLKGTKKETMEIVKRANNSTSVIIQTPRINELNTEGLTLRADWTSAVDMAWRTHWRSWTDGGNADGVFDVLVDWVGQFDCECTFAILADEYGYVKPNYVEPPTASAAGFSVTDLRHPIIERVRTSSPYIPHSLNYGEFASMPTTGSTVPNIPNGMLLYGVNAAGKSSLGKAVGLAILMAQIGCPVPATAMTLIPYTGLYTRILGNDNLWAGMSSFIVEMTEFRSILRSAAARVLVIGDELCAGTETASATAIVAAGIQTLVKRGAHFLFATHLHELTDIPDIVRNPAVKAYHLAVHTDLVTGCLTYDRALREGCGSPMYGLEVCRGLDMDPEFLAMAVALRKSMFTNDGKAHQSRYNATLMVSTCEVCGSQSELETHHIITQAMAATKGGTIAPGKHKNTKENLVVLCDSCHKRHHNGLLDIKGWIDTSEGRKLNYERGVT